MKWILQISAGTGPWEVRSFVASLAEALEPELEARGFRVESATAFGDPEAPSSIELGLEGEVSGRLDDLLGTHALVARSPRREHRSRKRWFAGVRLYPATPEERLEVDPAEVEVETSRAGGPGGQHVNTTDSAVRAIHRPSGISVRVVTERSQHANRRLALERLGEALAARARLARDAE